MVMYNNIYLFNANGQWQFYMRIQWRNLVMFVGDEIFLHFTYLLIIRNKIILDCSLVYFCSTTSINRYNTMYKYICETLQ